MHENSRAYLPDIQLLRSMNVSPPPCRSVRLLLAALLLFPATTIQGAQVLVNLASNFSSKTPILLGYLAGTVFFPNAELWGVQKAPQVVELLDDLIENRSAQSGSTVSSNGGNDGHGVHHAMVTSPGLAGMNASVKENYFRKMYRDDKADLQGHRISGALRVAVEDINSNPDILPNHTLIFKFIDTKGDIHQSVQGVMTLWNLNVSVIIGPDETCQTEAMIAAAQNLPMISFKCTDHTVSDKKKYSTFARTVPDERKISKALIALLKFYDWKRFALVYANNLLGVNLMEAIKRDSKRENMQILNISSFNLPIFEDDYLQTIVSETYKKVRVYVFYGGNAANTLQLMMLAMDEFKLFAKGEYVLICLCPSFIYINPYDANMNHFYRPSALSVNEFFETPEFNKIVDLSKFLLVLVPTPIDLERVQYQVFKDKVVEYMSEPPFQFYHKRVAKRLFQTNFSPYMSYLYDAVMLYAKAADAVLREGGSYRDGVAIMKKILNQHYESMQGFSMTMDENGDAQGNYTLLTRQRLPDKHQNLEHGMVATAHFINYGSYLPTMQLVDRISMKWHTSDRMPPKDMPECGFEGELCAKQEDYTSETVAVVFAVIFCVVGVISFMWYRNRKYEQELAGLIWKIDPRDIKFRPCGSFGAFTAGSKLTVASQESTDLGMNYFGYDPSAVAMYKGSVVAIKTISYARKTREISRATKIEMKNMRSLHHDNVNNFLGIIVESTCIRVVREYCAKGSLFDVLLNENLKLDQLFIASFIDDLLKGMIYIHESELHVHGNLKSTNSVITSRWTLQVSDFGLHELRDGQEYDSEESLFYSLLWTAPELLRDDALHHPPKGTQKADIYSFGIIFHEILSRNGPYDIYKDGFELNPREVIANVCNESGFSFYRPNLADLELQGYMIETMENCWDETPARRVDFRSIRQRLKLLFKGILKRNIMDHMITMMEKYQTHLEELVDERTEELKEEKKRTEILLYRMLPKSVAAQLVKGEDVVPESYEYVTVYFSDIVGFTSLSADSTPLEVVQFLNALYTLFDRVIHQYDVYKVETIGDAYMVVSGLPIRNGDKHAGEIATMALHLLEKVKEFQIPHRKDQPCLLRIGIHTGPCVAGVVGRTMPRYCLFGDTVNTASRMESNGLPLKIHISDSTKMALDKLGGYITEERGLVPVKGKGEMRTHWLQGKIDSSGIHDDMPPMYEDVMFFGNQPSRLNTRVPLKKVSLSEPPLPTSNVDDAGTTRPLLSALRPPISSSAFPRPPSVTPAATFSKAPPLAHQASTITTTGAGVVRASRLLLSPEAAAAQRRAAGVKRAESARKPNNSLLNSNKRRLEFYPMLTRSTISDEGDINARIAEYQSLLQPQADDNGRLLIAPFSGKLIENSSDGEVSSAPPMDTAGKVLLGEEPTNPPIRKRSLSYPDNVQALAEQFIAVERAAHQSTINVDQSTSRRSSCGRRRPSAVDIDADDDSEPLLNGMDDIDHEHVVTGCDRDDCHEQSPTAVRKRSFSCNDAQAIAAATTATQSSASSILQMTTTTASAGPGCSIDSPNYIHRTPDIIPQARHEHTVCDSDYFSSVEQRPQDELKDLLNSRFLKHKRTERSFCGGRRRGSSASCSTYASKSRNHGVQTRVEFKAGTDVAATTCVMHNDEPFSPQSSNFISRVWNYFRKKSSKSDDETSTGCRFGQKLISKYRSDGAV